MKTTLFTDEALMRGSQHLPGSNMRLLPIVASTMNLRDRNLYGVADAQTMLANIALHVCFSPLDSTAERLPVMNSGHAGGVTSIAGDIAAKISGRGSTLSCFGCWRRFPSWQ